MKKSVKKVIGLCVFAAVFAFNMYYSSGEVDRNSLITLNELQAVADGDGEDIDTCYEGIGEVEIIPYGRVAPGGSIFDRLYKVLEDNGFKIY